MRYQGKKDNPNRESLYKMDHTCIAEETLGRKLEKNECVHHINGIKTDNRKENLVVCAHGFHSWLHNEVKNRALAIHPELLEEVFEEIMLNKFGVGDSSTLHESRNPCASYPTPIRLKDC